MTNDLSTGTRVKALDFPRAYQSYHNTTIANISTTTYTVGDPEVAVRFQAPSSGRVAVSISAGVRNNSANADRLFVAFRMLEGDPADSNLVQTEDVKLGVSNAATQTDDFQYGGQVTMVGGLTPGAFYYAQVRYRTTLGSGTADIAHRHILVFPVA
jgi:hypothetical protein